MKKAAKIAGILLGVFIMLVIAGILYFNSAFPDVDPPTNVKVEITPPKLARGEYLANHVAVCMDCHSQRDWTKFSGPITAGTIGGGGDIFDEKIGFPGKVFVKNITPAAIGNWTDGELIRAIINGVNKDNKALFPLMPYPNYNQLTEEDLHSIVAYVRSLKPIENTIPETELNFPLNFIVKTMPIKAHNPMNFDRNDPVEYGKYLATISGCQNCHTQSEKGEQIAGMEFAGGEEFQFPSGIVRSSNISPDEETGIGRWTEELFIQRFKSYAEDSLIVSTINENDFNTPMPWTMYAGITEEDLKAIFSYLKTLKPIKNKVQLFTPNKLAAK